MSESLIVRLEKAGVIRALRDDPAFSELFLHHLLTRNIRIEEDLVDQLFNSSEKRLARVLLLLANFGKEGKPEPVMTKISQETLAGIIGTTRSRVSLFMNKFHSLGFIEYNGGLHVHSSLLMASSFEVNISDSEMRFAVVRVQPHDFVQIRQRRAPDRRAIRFSGR